ncbi:MAG TPA: replication-relaxation family protein [Anaerolineae bacterium]|nr:replication-relaxation family protein [Anaerolineae bacterium]
MDMSLAMSFQERDGKVLLAIDKYDGVLAQRHLKELFWPSATQRAMEMRLLLLYRHSYLNRPTQEEVKQKPVPELVYWLGWRGAAWLAAERGVEVEPPKSENENQLRRLENQLRERGIRWRREPRWDQLAHDLAVVDVRMAVEKAVGIVPTLSLEAWVPESVFRVAPDVVEYQIRAKDGRMRKDRRGVVPDAYFMIVDEERQRRGLPARARMLLEVDMGTHDTGSFAREKVAAGLAYINSSVYRARFGKNSGRWLMVIAGEVRMKHLMEQARQAVGEGTGAFFFMTLGQVKAGNVLTEPLWWQVGKREPAALLSRE